MEAMNIMTKGQFSIWSIKSLPVIIQSYMSDAGLWKDIILKYGFLKKS